MLSASPTDTCPLNFNPGALRRVGSLREESCRIKFTCDPKLPRDLEASRLSQGPGGRAERSTRPTAGCAAASPKSWDAPRSPRPRKAAGSRTAAPESTPAAAQHPRLGPPRERPPRGRPRPISPIAAELERRAAAEADGLRADDALCRSRGRSSSTATDPRCRSGSLTARSRADRRMIGGGPSHAASSIWICCAGIASSRSTVRAARCARSRPPWTCSISADNSWNENRPELAATGPARSSPVREPQHQGPSWATRCGGST
jgi:hypothetical protein